jgi:putative restriction endonuclease
VLRRFGYELIEVPAPPAGSAIYYGEVPECPAGTVFKDRREAYDAGVHRTTQAGIAGQAEGTQSICLSDGYSDDKVQGDLITYTGFGGRDANTGRHIADQKLEKGNLGLVENYKLGRPVRVLVRESVLTGKRSDTAYLYLGLFTVAGWSWGERDAFKVLIYQLRAVAGDSLVPGDVAAALVRGEDLPTQRRSSSVNRIIRNFDVAASVKRLYDNTCQICGTRLLTAAGPYSEGAHIRPLGVPHNGPDTLENILCLCPNCHALFDGHALTVQPDGTVLRLGESIGNLTVAAEHRLNFGHLAYQLEISSAKSSHANSSSSPARL